MPSESLMDFILSCLEKTIFYSDSGFYTVGPVRLERSGKAFVDFIGSSPARKNKRFCFSLAYSKNSLTGGTPRKLVRHHRSDVRKT